MDCSPPGSSVHGDSPGKNTGVGCHALFQGIFPTQGSNPGPGSSLSHQGIPRILEWVAYPFSRGSFWLRNQTRVSCIAGGFFTSWATREALGLVIKGLPSFSAAHRPSRVLLCCLIAWSHPRRGARIPLSPLTLDNFPNCQDRSQRLNPASESELSYSVLTPSSSTCTYALTYTHDVHTLVYVHTCTHLYTYT